jgi:hypothetical protein
MCAGTLLVVLCQLCLYLHIVVRYSKSLESQVLKSYPPLSEWINLHKKHEAKKCAVR